MQDDVDTQYGVALDSDMDMERDGDDAEEKEKEEEHEKDEEEQDEDEDEDEDDGNDPRTICQGEMIDPSAYDVDTIVDDQPTMLPEQGPVMRQHTPQPQPQACAPQCRAKIRFSPRSPLTLAKN